jgi:tetratricopeptide (TPR) repeat protein
VRQQFTLARQHLATALEVEPALQHEAQALEGFMLLRSHDWQGAQEILQATLAAAPDDPLAHYWYAMFLAAIGDYSGASMHAQQAVMLDPTSPVLRDRLADALLWVGDIDAARAEFVRAQELGFSLDFQSKGYIVFLAQTEQFSALQVLLVNMQLPADWVAAFVAGLAFEDQRAAAVTATHAAIAAGQIPRNLQFGAWVLLEQAQHAVAAFDYDLKSPDVELLWTTQSVGLRKAPGYEAMLARLGLSDEVRMSLQTKRSN